MGSKADQKEVLESQFYQRAHAAQVRSRHASSARCLAHSDGLCCLSVCEQLNESEYSALFVSGLFYLSSKGVAAPILSTLCVFGQVWYCWLRIFIGHKNEGGMDPPPYVPGAFARYIALGMMTVELYKLAKK